MAVLHKLGILAPRDDIQRQAPMVYVLPAIVQSNHVHSEDNTQMLACPTFIIGLLHSIS